MGHHFYFHTLAFFSALFFFFLFCCAQEDKLLYAIIFHLHITQSGANIDCGQSSVIIGGSPQVPFLSAVYHQMMAVVRSNAWPCNPLKRLQDELF